MLLAVVCSFWCEIGTSYSYLYTFFSACAHTLFALKIDLGEPCHGLHSLIYLCVKSVQKIKDLGELFAIRVPSLSRGRLIPPWDV